MKAKKDKAVRAQLRALEPGQGLTVGQLAERTGNTTHGLYRILHSMPDAYILSYAPPTMRGQRPAAVWAVVVPPPNCRPPMKTRLPRAAR